MSLRIIRNRYGNVEAIVAANEPPGITLSPLPNKQVTQLETRDVAGLSGKKLIAKLRELREGYNKE